MEIPGGLRGVTRSPLEWKIQSWKGQTEKKKPSLGGGGNGYFLEPTNRR